MRFNSIFWRLMSSSAAAGPARAESAAITEAADGAKQVCKWPIGKYGEVIKTARARKLGITTSPHKLNLVAKLVRGLSIMEAERQLTVCRKKASEDVLRVLAAAVTNARSFGLNEHRLLVNEAFVGKGKYLKRIRPWHGKGRYGIEHKKYAHLTVILKEVDDEEWERRVLPNYIHMRYRSEESAKKKLKNIKLGDWTTESQLNLSFRKTKENIEGLKAALQQA